MSNSFRNYLHVLRCLKVVWCNICGQVVCRLTSHSFDKLEFRSSDMQSLASIAVVDPNLKFQVQVVLMMYTGPVWHDNASHFLSTWYKCFNLAKIV
jgi:hypothetical protein